MNLRKILLLTVLAFILMAQSSALSCRMPTHEITFHCNSDTGSNNSLNMSNYDSFLDMHLGPESIPGPGKNNSSDYQVDTYRKIKYKLIAVNNTDLPSAEKALSESRALCSSGLSLHIYPKTDFKKEDLQDTTNCYRTEVSELENYYVVDRVGTTEPWICVEKVGGRMISGGETHYIAPLPRENLLFQILVKLLF